MPDVPTLAEAGITGYRWDPWFGVLVPARTQRPIVRKLNDEIRRILILPDVKERWTAMGGRDAADFARGNGPLSCRADSAGGEARESGEHKTGMTWFSVW
jgi:hypothetical protein